MATTRKKDFTQMNTNPVYGSIAEATAEPEEQEVLEEQEAQNTAGQKGRTYTDEEKQAYKKAGKTQGRTGCKMQRINLAFTADNYDYVKTMAAVSGQNMTEFVNRIIARSLQENAALYAQAKAFKQHF